MFQKQKVHHQFKILFKQKSKFIQNRIYLQFLSKMLLFISIYYLIPCTICSYYVPTYNFNKNISVPSVNTSDLCQFLDLKNNTIYRLGQSNILQNWNIQNLSQTYQNIQYRTFSGLQNVQYIDINIASSQITVPLSNSTSVDMLNSITLKETSQTTISWIILLFLSKVQSTSTQYIFLYYSSFGNQAYFYSRSMTYKYMIPIGSSTGKINSIISNDELTLLIWQVSNGFVYIFKNLGTWTYFTYYSPSVSNQNMNSITLSDNGTIAIFQYDSASNLIIYNVSSLTIMNSLAFTNTIINQVLFMDSDCHLLAVFVNGTTMQVYDIFTLTLQKTSSFSSISNYSLLETVQGTLYICLQHDIQVYTTTCPSLTYKSSTNQCVMCVFSTWCISCDSNTGLCNSCYTNYSLVNNTCIIATQSSNQTANNQTISNQTTSNQTTNSSLSNNSNQSSTNFIISENAQKLINVTVLGFTILNPAIAGMMFLFKITPFSSIFLSFISYWNLCCLYSILNPNCPKYLFKIHQMIFDCLQVSIFQLLGIQISTPTLDTQQINESYKVNYNITLDFFQANLDNLLVFCLSILILYIFILSRDNIIGKKSILRKYLQINTPSIIVGQFISFVPYCIITFKDIIQNQSCKQFWVKFNNSLQFILLFFCVLIPFIYLWSFKQKKNHFIFKRNQIRNLQNYQRHVQSIKELKNQKFQSNYQMREEFRMYLMNVTVPIFIILPTHVPFYLFNLVIFSYGVKNSFKTKKYKINSIMNSLYWPLYHFCYIIFDLFSENQQVLAYTGLFCLCVLFLGGLHQLFNIFVISFIQIFKQLITIVKQINQKRKKTSNNPFLNEGTITTQKYHEIKKSSQKSNKVACQSSSYNIQQNNPINFKQTFLMKSKSKSKKKSIFEITRKKKQPRKVKFTQNYQHFQKQMKDLQRINLQYKTQFQKKKKQTIQKQYFQINITPKNSQMQRKTEQKNDDKNFSQKIKIKMQKKRKQALKIQYIEQ